MKALLKLLARLYPSAWRNRYGAEYDALLEDRIPRLQDAFDIFRAAMRMRITTWSFAKIFLICSLTWVLTAEAITFAIPPLYTSQTVFTVKEAAPLPGDGFDRIFLGLTQAALNRNFLASIILDRNLYPRERAGMSLDAATGKMLRSITVRPMWLASPEKRDTASFTIQFEYSDPHVAQQVENELISQIVRENLRIRINSAATGTPHSPAETIRVETAASLPRKPSWPHRSLFNITGLFAGLLCGLVLAALLGKKFEGLV